MRRRARAATSCFALIKATGLVQPGFAAFLDARAVIEARCASDFAELMSRARSCLSFDSRERALRITEMSTRWLPRGPVALFISLLIASFIRHALSIADYAIFRHDATRRSPERF
jgi:hypothetical protein